MGRAKSRILQRLTFLQPDLCRTIVNVLDAHPNAVWISDMSIGLAHWPTLSVHIPKMQHIRLPRFMHDK